MGLVVIFSNFAFFTLNHRYKPSAVATCGCGCRWRANRCSSLPMRMQAKAKYLIWLNFPRCFFFFFFVVVVPPKPQAGQGFLAKARQQSRSLAFSGHFCWRRLSPSLYMRYWSHSAWGPKQFSHFEFTRMRSGNAYFQIWTTIDWKPLSPNADKWSHFYCFFSL